MLGNILWGLPEPELLVFEDVKFASSQAQAHLWASFRGVVWTWAARNHICIDCLDTSKLKLWTTGHGNATKEAMKIAACKRWPDVVKSGHDDNAIDAICLLQWARESHGIK
jgi:Holliday junction resolvasome RuvABC endonuclease subunit